MEPTFDDLAVTLFEAFPNALHVRQRVHGTIVGANPRDERLTHGADSNLHCQVQRQASEIRTSCHQSKWETHAATVKPLAGSFPGHPATPAKRTLNSTGVLEIELPQRVDSKQTTEFHSKFSLRELWWAVLTFLVGVSSQDKHL